MKDTLKRRQQAALLVAVLFVLCLGGILGCGRDPQVVKAGYVQSADEHLAKGRLAEAAIDLRNAVQVDPRDGGVRLKLADVFLKAGDVASATPEYVSAADLLPGRADVQLKAGGLLLLRGQFEDAKARAEKALATSPRNVDAQILLANALAGLSDFRTAIRQIEEAIRIEPSSGAMYATLGSIQSSFGHPLEAEAAFQKAAQLDSRSPGVRLAFANFYWTRGRLPEAEALLRTALDLDPDNVLAHRAMASLARVQNKPADAEPHLKKLVELTRAPEASIALADFYADQRDLQRAREILKPLSASARPDVVVRLAVIDHLEGRTQEAFSAVQRVLAADEGNLDALLAKIEMLLADGRYDEAAAVAQLATDSHPTAAAAFYALGRVQKARNQSRAAIDAFNHVLRLNPRAAGAQVELSRLFMAAGRSTEAVERAHDALRNAPQNAVVRLALVKALIANGDLDEGRTELGPLLSDYPNEPAVLVQTGTLLQRQNDRPGAQRAFERALAMEPESVEALSGLVALDLAAERPEAARARLAGRLASSHASPPMLMLGVRTALAAGDDQAAEQLLRRVLERRPSYLAAYVTLAQLYVRQRRLDAALTEFERLAARESNPVMPLSLAGMILYAQGRPAEAQARFERALASDPSAAVPANNLAWMLAERGETLDRALELARTAKRGLPDTPAVNDTLGFIYYKKNMVPQAIVALTSAAERDPGNPMYHFHLGLALARSGDRQAAISHLSRALKLDSAFAGSSQARTVLQTLEGP